MNNIFNPVYRQDYLNGYSNGQNPYLVLIDNQKEAYKFGFNQGRLDYEKMNRKSSKTLLVTINFGMP